MIDGSQNIVVDQYLEKHDKHGAILHELRGIILSYPFQETIKWGMPTYVYKERNLVGIGAFKNHVGLWFFQGTLLTDRKNLLRNAQQGKTKAMRQMIFKENDQIPVAYLKELIAETIHNQDQGRYVKIERNKKPIEIPEELTKAFSEDPDLKTCFDALTPGKQREYATYIASAKREKTRMDRLDKSIPLIRRNKGLNDQYKNC